MENFIIEIRNIITIFTSFSILQYHPKRKINSEGMFLVIVYLVKMSSDFVESSVKITGWKIVDHLHVSVSSSDRICLLFIAYSA